MKKSFCILSLLFSCIISGQNNFKTNAFNWITGIDDSVGFRFQNLSVGLRPGIGNIDFRDTKSLDQQVTTPEIEIEYGDYYSFTKNNPHNFTSYNSIKASVGYLRSKDQTNKLNPEGIRFGIGLSKGFGYNFSDLQILPYNKSETIWQYLRYDEAADCPATLPKEGIYSGKNREAGVLIGLNSNLDLNIAYSNISFSGDSEFTSSIAAGAIEYGTKRLISLGIQELISDSKLFPVIDFFAEAAVSYLFLSFNKYKHFFPFESKENFSISSFRIGIRKKFEIDLF